MPSATGTKKQSKTVHYGKILGAVLQSVAILWFVFIWFTFRTDLVMWEKPKTELLMPIYLLYLIGMIIAILVQVLDMQRTPPQNRAARVVQILLWPAISLILLFLMIDLVKFGFT